MSHSSPYRGTHQHFPTTHNQFLSTAPHTPAKHDSGRSPTRSPSVYPSSQNIGNSSTNHSGAVALMALGPGSLGQDISLSFGVSPSAPYLGPQAAGTVAGSPPVHPATGMGNSTTLSSNGLHQHSQAHNGTHRNTHHDPSVMLDRVPSSGGAAHQNQGDRGAGNTTNALHNNLVANQNIVNGSSAGSVSSSQAVRGPPRPYTGLFGHIGEHRSERELKKSGWLEKFSVGRGFFPVRNWQKRWFQITPDGLNYAKKPGAEMSSRTFIPFVAQRKPELRLCPVFLLPNVLPNIHLEASDPKVYYFGLKFEEKSKPHVLLLRTSAADERDQWVRYLAQFLHVGNLQGIPISHPLDPSVQRLYDPEQLDTRERIALRKVIVDWDEGYQEYRHKHVDRVNRALNSGVRLGLGAGTAAAASGSSRGGGSSNYDRNSSMGSSPQAIINDAVSRTTSAKSAKFTPGGTALINPNNSNSTSQPAHIGGISLEDTTNHSAFNANSPTSSHGAGNAFPVDVIIMDDTHVLALSGMDPSMARENYIWDNLYVDEGLAVSDYPTAKGNNNNNNSAPGLSSYQRQSRSHVLTLPSSPPTPTNDDL